MKDQVLTLPFRSLASPKNLWKRSQTEKSEMRNEYERYLGPKTLILGPWALLPAARHFRLLVGTAALPMVGASFMTRLLRND